MAVGPSELDNDRSAEGTLPEKGITIIGGGFSRGFLVIHLSKSHEAEGESIMVLETRELCSGATRRCGQ